MRKFLIVNPFGIGDCLFTTPLIRAIKEASSGNAISYWCNERVKPLFENHPDINQIFALSRGDLKKVFQVSWWEGLKKSVSLFRQLRQERFDVVFDFSLDHRYHLAEILLGIKKRIGFDYKNRGFLLTHKIKLTGYSDKHVVEYYCELLKFEGIVPKKCNLDLFVSGRDQERIRNILSHAGIKSGDLLIGIAPAAGASWGKDAKLKHWPALRFAELADRLSKDHNAKIVVLGDVSEQEIADVIQVAMKHKPLNLVGKTTLGELAAAIKCVKALVTNDGGPLHMATALGIKTVSIFGPVDEKVYGPFAPGPNHRVVTKDLECRPCYKNFRLAFCDKDRECIKSISTQEVYEAVRRLL